MPVDEDAAALGSLAGLRVLDLSRLLPGPFATNVLCELGATVDKIEDPHGGDYLRLMPNQLGGMNVLFRALNRGKRSAVLDLKHPLGREALLRLVPRYDVLVESFRPGVMHKLGLGYEALSGLHPGLVYCSVSGFGATGPHAGRAGHDLGYLARAGVLGVSGPGEAPPAVPGGQIADVGAALYAVTGILAALHERTRTLRGRFVDVALTEAASGFASFALTNALAGAEATRGHDALTGGIAPYRTYRTKDDRFVALAIVEPKFWIAFCQAVSLSPSMEALVPGPHQAQIVASLEAVFASKTRDEWARFADATDCCLEPVLEPSELEQDPQHRARGFFSRVDGEACLRSPLGAARTAAPAPTQGEQTREVLEDAGFSKVELDELRRQGVTR